MPKLYQTGIVVFLTLSFIVVLLTYLAYKAFAKPKLSRPKTDNQGRHRAIIGDEYIDFDEQMLLNSVVED